MTVPLSVNTLCPTYKYLLKVNERNTRTRCEKCPELTKETLE